MKPPAGHDRVRRGMGLAIVLFCAVGTEALRAEDSKKAKVFVLAGQSNMAGMAKATALEPPYDKPFPAIAGWNYGTRRWEALAPEVFDPGKKGTFGPEISFGRSIAERNPGADIRFIKGSMSGTNLYKQWAPVEGDVYQHFMRIVKPALEDLDKQEVVYEMAGMLWLQGESDAHEGKAESYEKNLTNFIAHMRAEFKTPAMPFIIARVRDHFGGPTGQARIVREAQVKVATHTPHVAWFDTDDCTMMDPGHYDAAGLIEIGKRFARGYEAVVGR
jgi:hypothetical protein